MSFEDFKQYKINEDTFCPHPWVSFYPAPTGNVFPCCIAMKYRPPSKVDADSNVDKMMNTDAFKEMRLKMINGERPRECSDCWIREDSGVRSDRKVMIEQQLKVKKKKQLLYDAIDRTNADGSVNDYAVSYLEFRDNNICNYKCRFCNINSSNTWIKEWKEMQRMHDAPENINEKTGVSESGVDWSKIDLSHLTNIHMAGGEPTAMDSTYWLLEHLIEIGRAPEIDIGIVSNSSRLVYKKKNILDLLSHFKWVNWSTSADAMGKAHDYLRAGGLDDWDKVESNIFAIQKFIQNHGEGVFKFHSTMNWNNAFQWWDMKRKLDIDNPNPINIEVFFSTGPDGHGLNDAPAEVLERIQQFYETKNNYKEVEQILKMCKKWMPKNSEENEKRLLKVSRYKEEQIYLDASRGQVWLDVFPEWADFWLDLPLPPRVRHQVFHLYPIIEKQIMDNPGKYFTEN